MSKHQNVRAALLTGIAALGGAVPAAVGDVETAAYIDDSNYVYKIVHMPDLDQSRADGGFLSGLPGNGNAYCVPTSTVDLMAYIANHGFPEVAPGAGNWQLSSMYQPATDTIEFMGQLMSTHPQDGTNGNGWFIGAWAWILTHGNKFVVNQYSANGNYSPTMTSMTKTALNGSIVNFAYGRYEVTGSFAGLDVIDRDGGHCVTLSRSLAAGNSRLLFCRDPAHPNDGNPYAQSQFADRMLTAQDRAVTTSSSVYGIKVMTAINYDPENEKHAYLDGYLAIRPKAGYSFQPGGPSSSFIQFIGPWSFLGGHSSGETSFEFAGLLNDAVIGPDWNSFFTLVSVDDLPVDLCQLDLLSGEMIKIADIPDAETMVFGRKRGLYVKTQDMLLMVDVMSEDPIQQATDLPVPCDQMCYDDARDEVILLSSEAKKILRYPEDLGAEPHTSSIPETVPLGGEDLLALNPATGELWILPESSSCLYRLGFDEAGDAIAEMVCLPGISAPTSVDFDDQGHLYVVQGGRPAEFMMSESGAWTQVDDSPWSAYQTDGPFRMLKSRTNHDPSMDEPGPQHIDPAELVDLVGDVYIPDCETPAANEIYGEGKKGSFGVPRLVGVDLPYIGAPSSIRVENALPGALPILVLGFSSVAVPFDGGTLLAAPQIVLPLPVPIAPDGTVVIQGTIPPDTTLCGVELFHQILVPDPAASGFYGLALTNGLKRTLGS